MRVVASSTDLRDGGEEEEDEAEGDEQPVVAHQGQQVFHAGRSRNVDTWQAAVNPHCLPTSAQPTGQKGVKAAA